MELKYLNSFKCYWILTDYGGPPWVGVEVGGWWNGGSGMIWGWQEWCEDDRNNMGMTGTTWGRRGRHHYHDKHVGGHLQFLYMCVCMHVCMCMHVHVSGDTPHVPRPLTHLPPPQSGRKPKIPKFSKSWTNRDNSILFEDSLPLNIPELI